MAHSSELTTLHPLPGVPLSLSLACSGLWSSDLPGTHRTYRVPTYAKRSVIGLMGETPIFMQPGISQLSLCSKVCLRG